MQPVGCPGVEQRWRALAPWMGTDGTRLAGVVRPQGRRAGGLVGIASTNLRWLPGLPHGNPAGCPRLETGCPRRTTGIAPGPTATGWNVPQGRTPRQRPVVPRGCSNLAQIGTAPWNSLELPGGIRVSSPHGRAPSAGFSNGNNRMPDRASGSGAMRTRACRPLLPLERRSVLARGMPLLGDTPRIRPAQCTLLSPAGSTGGRFSKAVMVQQPQASTVHLRGFHTPRHMAALSSLRRAVRTLQFRRIRSPLCSPLPGLLMPLLTCLFSPALFRRLGFFACGDEGVPGLRVRGAGPSDRQVPLTPLALPRRRTATVGFMPLAMMRTWLGTRIDHAGPPRHFADHPAPVRLFRLLCQRRELFCHRCPFT